jgi:hypothetical protein
MHRTDADGFGAGNVFQEGAPGTGLLASKVGAKWLNALQDELAAIAAAGGLALDDEDNGQVLEALGLLFSAGNAAAALKNKLINGGFELWQRGTSIPVATAIVFAADRWAATADPSGSGTATITRGAFALGQTNVPGNPLNFLQWTQTVAASQPPQLFQPIEDVARYSSGSITVSFWAKASTTLAAVTRCFQNFGTGGSTTVAVGAQGITLTTSWQKFTATYVLPSVAGKTIGPLNHLRVGLTLPNSATFTVQIADFQVEAGESATAFDRRPPQLEQLLAFRYFQKSYALGTDPNTATRVGALHRCAAGDNSSGIAPLPNMRERFRVPMRSVPTIAWYAPDADTAAGSSAPYNVAGIGKFSTVSASAGHPIAAIAVNATLETTEEETGYIERADITSWGFPALNPSGAVAWAQWTASAELA